MKFIVKTKKIAYAVGLDAGNRNARKNGRTVWNEEDARIAAKETDKAWPKDEYE